MITVKLFMNVDNDFCRVGFAETLVNVHPRAPHILAITLRGSKAILSSLSSSILVFVEVSGDCVALAGSVF